MKTKKRTALATLSLLLVLLLLTACMPSNPEPTAEPSTTPSAESTTAPPTTEETNPTISPTQTQEPTDNIHVLESLFGNKVPTPFDDLVVPADAPRDATELMMAPEDYPEAVVADFQFAIYFESPERLVIGNCCGVYVYDLIQRKVIYSVDLMKVFGLRLNVQGGGGQAVWVSQDGQRVSVGYMANAGGPFNKEAGYYEDWYCEQFYYIDLEDMTYYKAPYQPMEDVYTGPEEGGVIFSVGLPSIPDGTASNGPWNYYPNYPDLEFFYPDLFSEYVPLEAYEPTPAEP